MAHGFADNQSKDLSSISVLHDSRHGSFEAEFQVLKPDNRNTANQIVDLFHARYGERYPCKSVYDNNFWSPELNRQNGFNKQTEATNRISIVVTDGNKLLAHLALRHNKQKNQLDLLLSAIRPSHTRHLQSLGSGIWNLIRGVSESQDLRCLSYFNYAAQMTAQIASTDYFGSKVVALIPFVDRGPVVNTSLPSAIKNLSLTLMYNPILPDYRAQKILFPPLYHFSFVESLYQSLGLLRTFASPAECTVLTLDKLLTTTGASAPIITRCDVRPLSECVIQPSACVEHFAAATLYLSEIEIIEREAGRRLVVKIALDDPLCPAFVNELERANFHFCGIAPNQGAHDYILYARYPAEDLRVLNLYPKRARYLRDYMSANYVPVR